MVTEKIRLVAKLMEDIGNLKIKLAELLNGQEFSDEERDTLYFSAIKDQLGIVFENCPKLRLEELAMALQIEEMFSQENIHFTIKDLNHDPSEDEIKEHYMNCGRPSRFRERFKAITEFVPSI